MQKKEVADSERYPLETASDPRKALANIQKKLDQLEKNTTLIAEIVSKIEAMENAELEYMNAIKTMEARELDDLGKISNMEDKELQSFDKISSRKFTDIMSWKTAIWENCPHKQLIDSNKMVLFNCALTKQVCSFQNCPRNVQGHKD